MKRNAPPAADPHGPLLVEPHGDGEGAPPVRLADVAPSGSLGWWALRTVYRARWFIIAVTTLVMGAAIAIALSLPVQYAATARVLLPEGGGGLGSLLGSISPIGGALLGGGAGDYNRYLAILSSRSTQEAAVQRFELVERYHTADTIDPEGGAQAELSERTAFEVDQKYDFLSITVYDEEPRVAAAMANFFVAELNRRNQELSAQNAGLPRQYVEQRYAEAERALDSLRSAMQDFQETNGVVELPAMAEALMTSLASARAEVARSQVEYEALRAQYGDENPQVQAARDVYEAASEMQEDLVNGRDAAMPVPLSRLPALGNEYARIYQEVLTQTKILETTRPLLEQARFAEEQQRTAVQILDEAVPPLRKAKPARAIIVLSSVLSAFVLTTLFALAWGGVRRYRTTLIQHVRADA